ncbi:hypothetical protein [Caulobacter sp. LARHSG274]
MALLALALLVGAVALALVAGSKSGDVFVTMISDPHAFAQTIGAALPAGAVSR